MVLEKLIQDIKSNDRFYLCTKSFIDRINYAEKLLLSSQNMSSRTISVPHSLNDLRVRINLSLRILSLINTERLGLRIPACETLEKDLLHIPIEQFANRIDALLLVTGEYNAIINVVKARRQELLTEGNFLTLIYSGTAISKDDVNLSIHFFDTAAKEAPDELKFLTAMQRAIVITIKRKKDFKEARERLTKMIAIKPTDINNRLIIMALLNNLYSLQLIIEDMNEKNQFSAELALVNADLMATRVFVSDIEDPIKDQAMRYKSQIAINYAQLLQNRNHFDAAVILLENNLVEVKKYAMDYYSEALGALAYAFYLNKNYKKAIDFSKKAIIEYAKIGEILAIRSSREVLIGAYEKSNQHTKALEIAQIMIEDPLGEKEELPF